MSGDFAGFDGFVRQATGGLTPYEYQRRIAVDGLPDVIDAPNGAGKTMAAILPWLYRRRFHPDPQVRSETPRRLVYVLPRHSLTEHIVAVTGEWLRRLDLGDEVGVQRLSGGSGNVSSRWPSIDWLSTDWRMHPSRDNILVGTVDMVTSRQLNRGYGESRFDWPIDFGLLSNGCHIVYDESRLMGPALATSRQLHGLRRRLGTAEPCSATWMSMAVDHDALDTIDAPVVSSIVSPSDDDRSGPLAVRIDATRRIEEIASPGGVVATTLATEIGQRHRPGTLTLAVLNTLEQARALDRALDVLDLGVEHGLLHGAFCSRDREAAVRWALGAVDDDAPGRIVVSTACIEAGVDISAQLVVTEAAPWPSMVERAGRCNREGHHEDAALVWVEPKLAQPHTDADIAVAVTALRSYEGTHVTTSQLAATAVSGEPEIPTVIRQVDLVELFDTLPDVVGDDIDVSRFITESPDCDIDVAWADVPESDGGDSPVLVTPGASERCPVPVRELAAFLRRSRSHGWRFDDLASIWRTCRPNDLRPGMVVVLDRASGGYTPGGGWDPAATAPQDRASGPGDHDGGVEHPAGFSDDPLTFRNGRWVTLTEHLDDVEREIRDLAKRLAAGGCSGAQLEAAALAGRYHDVGKAHPSFQAMLLATTEATPAPLPDGDHWAKSTSRRLIANQRKHFRHELASALAIIDDDALEGTTEPDLVRYLVAAHHGRVRLRFRPLPDEQFLGADTMAACGIHHDDELPAVNLPEGSLPATVLSLAPMMVGTTENGRSWASRMLTLRDRDDLGPIRLGYLEMLVRIADQRVTAAYERGTYS